MSRFGYHGKVLHLDLATRRSWVEECDDRLWRIYGGGGLLATYYLLRECPSGIDPFDPANLLILTSSVVAGHPYAGLARYTASAKSPLTGGIGETRCEGPFGIALKGSGADALVFHGAIDIQYLLPLESAETVRRETKNRIQTLGTSGGYILAPSHNLQEDIPFENIMAMYDVDLRG